MSEKQETDSIRVSQVMAAALAAITAAVLGSTMGVAGTVIGAGLASIVSTVGGALYLRSIQRTRQGVASVKNLVVARAGTTKVTLIEEKPADESVGVDQAGVDQPVDEVQDEERSDGDEPARRRLRWPAMIAAAIMAFVLGMLVVTGVEWLRGEPLSGGDGTTLGGIVRVQPDSGDERDNQPPASDESTPPNTGGSTVTVTEPPATSENPEPSAPSTGPSEPDPGGGEEPPATTTPNTPTGSATAPPPSG